MTAIYTPQGPFVTGMPPALNGGHLTAMDKGIANANTVLNALANGVAGDGTTDDVTAINALITSAATFGGANVFLASATYRITSSIIMQSNVTLSGSGAGSVIMQDMAAPAHALITTAGAGVVNISVHDLAFDASSSTNNRDAIAINGASNVFIDRVLVKKSYYDAIQLVACFNAVVSNCIGLACGRNGIAVDQTVGASSKVTITNCIMIADPSSANLFSGYDVESGQEVILTGCVSDGPFQYGCTVLGETFGGTTYLSKWIQIRGLTVSGQTTYGVYLIGTAGTVTCVAIDGLTVLPGTGSDGFRVIGDVQQWSLTNFNLGGTSRASINGITTVVSGATPAPGIIGNGRITGYPSHGILLASQAVVSGVHAYGNTGSGVVAASVTDVVVIGCILTGNTRYGIETTGTSDRLVNVGNNLRGNTSGDTLLVGAANVNGLYMPRSGLQLPPTNIGTVIQIPKSATSASGVLTFDATRGAVTATLTENITSMSFANPVTNQGMTVTLVQDATGGRTYVWPSNAKFAGGAGPSDTTANKRTTVTFVYDGTNFLETSRAVAVG